MFVLQKKILFARGLNWDQSCLWKTPPSHFLLFSPLACPYFFYFFSSPDFWGVKEAPCKNLYVFGENWQRNQFPKLTNLLLLFVSCYNFPIVHSMHMWRLMKGDLFNVWLMNGELGPIRHCRSDSVSTFGKSSDKSFWQRKWGGRSVALCKYGITTALYRQQPCII